MIYSLFKNKSDKAGTSLHANSTYYSDEYAEAMCDLYLKDELEKDENGRIKRFYRLHAKYPHSQEQALAYDISCPKCKTAKLKQVGRQLTTNELGLYMCPVCGK